MRPLAGLIAGLFFSAGGVRCGGNSPGAVLDARDGQPDGRDGAALSLDSAIPAVDVVDRPLQSYDVSPDVAAPAVDVAVVDVGIDHGTAFDVPEAGLDVEQATGCANALPLRCGDRFRHSTVTQGRPNAWSGYSHTQRAESGRETIYALETPATCQVVATLGDLAVDLDLAVLAACRMGSDIAVSSTPMDLQTVETVGLTAERGRTYYVVVDGYSGAEGSYSLQVDCNCGG